MGGQELSNGLALNIVVVLNHQDAMLFRTAIEMSKLIGIGAS